MEKFFNFFFKNENKVIRYASIGFLVGIAACIIIVGIKISLNSDDVIDDVNKATKRVVNSIASAAVAVTDGARPVINTVASAALVTAEGTKDMLTLEHETVVLDKPDVAESWKENAVKGKVEGSASKVVVKNEKTKVKLISLIEGGEYSKEFTANLTQLAAKVLSNRHEEADAMFEDIKEGVPSFAQRHYDIRDKKDLIVECMQKELLTPKTLEDFYVATAIELDQILFEAVNKELDGYLKEIQLTNPNLTLDELKARMPTAKEICESIYDKVAEKNLTGKYKSEVNEYVSELARKNNMASKGPLLAVASVFVTGTAFVVGGPLAGFICAGVTGLLAHGARIAIHDEARIKAFTEEMQSAVIKTRDQFKETLGVAVKDILEQYASMDFLKGAEIEVDSSTPLEVTVKE